MQLADSIVPWLPQRDRAKGRCVVVLDSSGIHLLADVRKAANRHLTGVWLGLESWAKRAQQASVRRGSKARPWTSPRPTRKSAPSGPPFPFERIGTSEEFHLPRYILRPEAVEGRNRKGKGLPTCGILAASLRHEAGGTCGS